MRDDAYARRRHAIFYLCLLQRYVAICALIIYDFMLMLAMIYYFAMLCAYDIIFCFALCYAFAADALRLHFYAVFDAMLRLMLMLDAVMPPYAMPRLRRHHI